MLIAWMREREVASAATVAFILNVSADLGIEIAWQGAEQQIVKEWTYW